MCTIDRIARSVKILLVSFFCFACNDDGGTTPSSSYVFQQPEHFPRATYSFENNAVTKEGFELGRMLFYDPILSVDSTVSCSTCHKQATGFADPTHQINHGVGNRFGKRNSPGIVNMAFRNNFFFDGGVTHLDFVPINAITAEAEMDNTLENVIAKLTSHDGYREAFDRAFPGEQIDSKHLLQALSQFTVMMVSDQSKFDEVLKNTGTTFTVSEASGYAIFQSKCESCHAGVLLTDDDFHNNGLDESFSNDAGRSIITNNIADVGKFRVPSLRNVAVTPPYMHDGRFNTLLDVLNHYSDGVQDSPTLDPLLKQSDVLGISLSYQEKLDLIKFLETLTDQKIKNDPKFSDPF